MKSSVKLERKKRKSHVRQTGSICCVAPEAFVAFASGIGAGKKALMKAVEMSEIK